MMNRQAIVINEHYVYEPVYDHDASGRPIGQLVCRPCACPIVDADDDARHVACRA